MHMQSCVAQIRSGQELKFAQKTEYAAQPERNNHKGYANAEPPVGCRPSSTR